MQSISENESISSKLIEQLNQLQLSIPKNKNSTQSVKKKEELLKQIESINGKIKQLYSSKKFVKNEQSDLILLEDTLNQTNIEYSRLDSISKQFEDQIYEIIGVLNNLSSVDLPIYNQLIKERKIKDKKLNEINNQIQHIESSSKKLLELKYDENCNYCVNNVFVIEAKQCALDLDNYKVNYQKIMAELEQIKAQINKMQTPDQIKSTNEKITSLNYEKALNQQKKDLAKREIDEMTREIANHRLNLSIEDQIGKFSDDIQKLSEEVTEISKIIEQKNKINEEITSLKESINTDLIDRLNLQKEMENIEKLSKVLETNHENYLINVVNEEKIANIKISLIPLETGLQVCKETRSVYIEYEKNLLKIDGYLKEIDISERKMNELREKLEIHKKNEDIKLANSEFENKLKNLQLDKGRYIIKLYDLNKKKENIIIKRTVLETNIKNSNALVNELVQLKLDYDIYQLYCQCLGKNGLPHNLLMKIINRVSEISNNILKQIADFTIQFVEDSDKKKLAVLLHRQGLTQSTDLTSGFEEFIIELSLKIAFSMISNVTRPNFLAIDEGFGCLDSDHLSSLTAVLNFIKTKFDFILIITHVNELKGQGDYYIDINKLHNGDSQVNNCRVSLPSKKLILKPPKLKLKLNPKGTEKI